MSGQSTYSAWTVQKLLQRCPCCPLSHPATPLGAHTPCQASHPGHTYHPHREHQSQHLLYKLQPEPECDTGYSTAASHLHKGLGLTPKQVSQPSKYGTWAQAHGEACSAGPRAQTQEQVDEPTCGPHLLSLPFKASLAAQQHLVAGREALELPSAQPTPEAHGAVPHSPSARDSTQGSARPPSLLLTPKLGTT